MTQSEHNESRSEKKTRSEENWCKKKAREKDEKSVKWLKSYLFLLIYFSDCSEMNTIINSWKFFLSHLLILEFEIQRIRMLQIWKFQMNFVDIKLLKKKICSVLHSYAGVITDFVRSFMEVYSKWIFVKERESERIKKHLKSSNVIFNHDINWVQYPNETFERMPHILCYVLLFSKCIVVVLNTSLAKNNKENRTRECIGSIYRQCLLILNYFLWLCSLLDTYTH